MVRVPVVHAGRAHRDRARPDRHLLGAALAVPDDQSVTVVIAFLAMRLHVRGYLSSSAATSIRRAPSRAVSSSRDRPVRPVLRRLAADDLQHGCRLLPPARQGAAVDQAGGYAAGVM